MDTEVKLSFVFEAALIALILAVATFFGFCSYWGTISEKRADAKSAAEIRYVEAKTKAVETGRLSIEQFEIDKPINE